MTVCALAMLEAGVGSEVTLIGGVCLLVLATVLAWLSTHVPDNEHRMMGTVISRNVSVPLVGLGSPEYRRVLPTSDHPTEAQSTEDTQEDKPDEEDSGLGIAGGEELSLEHETSHATGSTGPAVSGVDQLLDIQGLRTVPSPESAPTSSPMPTEKRHDLKTREYTEERTTSCSTAADIIVRLKFFDDTEELATLSPQDTIGNLKSKYFSGKEHQTKLIFQGQLLRDPNRSLFSLNITHKSVVHCHISQNPPSEGAVSEEEPRPARGFSGSPADTRIGSTVVAASDRGLDMGGMVVPVFAVMLGVIWYFRIHYVYLFTTPATISLVGVTIFFVLMIYTMYEH